MNHRAINPYRAKTLPSSSSEEPTHILKVNTNLSEGDYWIRLRRNNQYVPYKPAFGKKTSDTSDSGDASIAKGEESQVFNWTTVGSKKKDKPIYYWVVDSHNLFDRRDKSFRLYFTDPDTTQIENMDQTNYMAIDSAGQLRLLHSQLKHNGMKMNPTFYISRTIKQVEDALKHVKYCVVKIENNEQKLVESPQLTAVAQQS